MALVDKPAYIYTVKSAITLLLLLVVVLVCQLGGFLSRCMREFAGSNTFHLSYWPDYDLSREIFSVVTGLIVIISAFHIRAGLVVWLLTQCSLYVGLCTYMNIFSVSTNCNSRSGIFDWMLGRQEGSWNYTQNLMRDFSGTSLRGLLWTVPQGYVLQQLGFGWQYSLSGSLMGAIYFAGSQIMLSPQNDTGQFFSSTLQFSEYMWGVWVWLALLSSCATQLIHRIRKWVYSKSTASIRSPYIRYIRILYESLNYTVTDMLYQFFLVLFWTILSASTVFYSLVIQTDLRNKGQTFFGLFSSVAFLTFFLSWKWASAYTAQQLRLAKARHSHRHIDQRVYRSPPSGIPDIDRLERTPHNETDPLLPWPYSHPDKAFMDTRRTSPLSLYDATRSTTPPSSYDSYYSPSSTVSSRRDLPQRRPMSSGTLAFVLVWPSVEKWVWLDAFACLRHLVGVVSLLATLLTIGMAAVAFAMDLTSPRFDSRYYVCNVTMVDDAL